MKSRLNKFLVEAYERGYRVNDGKVYNPSGKQIKLQLDKNGYYRFTIRLNGKNNSVRVHRLVAYQKYGDKLFEPGIEVRHRNNNSKDNLDENVFIGTSSQNKMDKNPEDRLEHAKKASKAAQIVNTKYDAEVIKKTHAELKSYKKVMEIFGITSKGTLHNILKRGL